jgi:hypothetical protein
MAMASLIRGRELTFICVGSAKQPAPGTTTVAFAVKQDFAT